MIRQLWQWCEERLRRLARWLQAHAELYKPFEQRLLVIAFWLAALACAGYIAWLHLT